MTSPTTSPGPRPPRALPRWPASSLHFDFTVGDLDNGLFWHAVRRLRAYDQQDANRRPAGRGVGAFETGYVKQRELTLGLGGRQALNHHKTVLLLLMGGRSFQTVAATNSQPSWIAYTGIQLLLGPREPVESQVEQTKPDLSPR